MALRAVRIDSQTYRIGDYVAFQLESLQWRLGKPVDWDEPVGGGLIAGTVTEHRLLRDCRQTVARRLRMARDITPRMPNYKRAGPCGYAA